MKFGSPRISYLYGIYLMVNKVILQQGHLMMHRTFHLYSSKNELETCENLQLSRLGVC